MGNKHHHIPKPPRWADRLLVWYADPDWHEEIQGDLHEAFYDRAEAKGCAYARRQYIIDVLKFIKPSALQKFRVHQQYPPMFKNYFKIAIRSLVRKKAYSLINAIGLSLGLACVFLSFLYLRNETRYDGFHEDAENIYRVTRAFREQEYSPLPFEGYWSAEPSVQNELPDAFEMISGVEQVTHFVISDAAITGRRKAYYVRDEAGQEFIENKVLFTNRGKQFLDIFSWNFLQGKPEGALREPHQAIISESTAVKYFGSNWRKSDTALGSLLRIDSTEFMISGVIEDVPEYSHFDFDIALSIHKIPAWGAYTYFTKSEGAGDMQLSEQMNNTYLDLYPDRRDDPREKGTSIQAITDIHLYSDKLYELKKPGDVRYLYIFGIIGLVILLITVTNYTNLSVALYAGRQKEIGMRKVMGAYKREVTGQFLFEAVLLSLVCLPIALVLLELGLPYFNQLMDLELANAFFREWALLLAALGLATFIGLLSGFYPALMLSQKRMTELFKSRLGASGSGFGLRRSLVGFQLILLIALGSATFFINQQLDFIANKDLGFEKEGLIFFKMRDVEDYRVLRERLVGSSTILEVGTGSVPGANMFNQTTYKLQGGEEVMSDGTMLYMDRGMVRALGLEHPAMEQLQSGKDEIMLINETAAQTLSNVYGTVREDLVGKVWINEPEYVSEEGEVGFPDEIDGIIDDFHHFTLKEEITPIFIRVRNEAQSVFVVMVKTQTDRLYEAIDLIEAEYAKLEQVIPFEVGFMDERLENLYAKEQQIGQLSTGLSLVAVFLAVLGLLGLVSFMTYQRRSEISVRKIFGASVTQIMLLINREFAMLVGIATLLAAPLAYFGVNAWLDNFAYRISPGVLGIAGVGLISLLVVVLVVSVQSFRTAQQNPAQTLREE